MTDPPTEASHPFADRYVIERELGHGGTSVVYLARDTRDGTNVAIKILLPELAEGVAADRFLREIRLNQQLDHPNIVPVLDSGVHDGRPYFVLPLMEEGTLRDKLDRSRQLPVPDAISIARTVARALTHAHTRGFIHRDVKPENVLFTRGEPVLADFGIARAIERSMDDTTATTTGIVRGTPPYMSPEQLTGSTYDGRTDVYALACVVYEMVAGMQPYVGPTPESVIAQKMTQPPRPLRVYRPTASQALEDVVARGLAMSPADRYQTPAEFADALEQAITTTAPPRRLLPFLRHLDHRLTSIAVVVARSVVCSRQQS